MHDGRKEIVFGWRGWKWLKKFSSHEMFLGRFSKRGAHAPPAPMALQGDGRGVRWGGGGGVHSTARLGEMVNPHFFKRSFLFLSFFFCCFIWAHLGKVKCYNFT